MRVFLDTKFTGLHQETTLISIGLVAESGRDFYAEFTDFDRSQVTPRIQDNVINKLCFPRDELAPPIANTTVTGNKELVTRILGEWLNSLHPPPLDMWADCLAYDWVLFCQLWGGAFFIPRPVYYIPFDLCTLLYLKGVDPDITREVYAYGNEANGEKHSALWNAKTIKACYEKLMGLERE